MTTTIGSTEDRLRALLLAGVLAGLDEEAEAASAAAGGAGWFVLPLATLGRVRAALGIAEPA